MSVYQVTWLQRWQSQECRNTFYYQTTVGEPSTGEWQDIADEIRADLVTYWDNMCDTTWLFYAIDYRRVDTPGLLSFRVIPTSGDLTGQDGGEPNPSQVALLVSNKGATTKPNRTRTYLCGMAGSQLGGSYWSSTILNNAEALIDVQSNLNSGGTNPLSRVSAQWNTAHTQVLVYNDMSGAASVASNIAATQRRRRIGVGI